MKPATILSRAGLLLFIPAMLSAATAPRWSVFETARDNGHRLSPVSVPALANATVATAPTTLTLQPAEKFQEMIGFGGALTESSAWVLAQLTPENRAAVIRRYYDPQEGIGYTLARTHLNSCDFSLSMWSLDETSGDYDLHDFTLAPMRKWVLPLLQDANRIAGKDNFRLLVSPWSPPYWMKTNFRMDDGGSLRGSYRAPWANFYVKFLQAMRDEEHLPVWGLTVQNEPEAHQTWDSCLYTPEEERDFVRDHLGPALEHAGFSSVKLIGWDHNRDRIEARAAALYSDPAVAKYFWGLGVHWYVSDDFAASARVHAAYPDKHVLFTEGCFEGGDGLGSWSHGEGYAHQMIGDFKHWVCGFIDWNIVLDQRGGPNHVGNFCDAPVLVDTNTKVVSYHASFYYIAHFSKFVRPGAHRVGSTGGPTGLESIAFENPDGSLVTVVVNATDLAAPFQLNAGGETLACTIPAHGIQTYVRAR
jgi:glucosylceramidase